MPRTVKLNFEQERREWRLYEPLQWPRYEYEIVTRPWAGLLAVFRFSMQDWPTEGVFVPKGWKPDKWTASSDHYQPLPVADRILRDIHRLDEVENLEAVLAFVNRWGVLGVGVGRRRIVELSERNLTLAEVKHEPQMPAILAALRRFGRPAVTVLDGVHETSQWLQWIRRTARGIHELNTGKDDPWEAIAAELAGVACDITLSLRLGPGGRPELVYATPSLLHVLALRLVEWATGAQNLVRCANPKCSAYFTVTDARQKFCGSACRKQVGVDRLRAARRRQSR